MISLAMSRFALFVVALVLGAISLQGCGGDAVGTTTTTTTTAQIMTTATNITKATTTTTTTQTSRGQRLCAGELKVLYHQTDMTACTNILKTGFDIGRAKAGNQGMGAYFADDAPTTGIKARHPGCVVVLLARLGNVFDMNESWLPDMGHRQDGCDSQFGYKLMKEGFDSVTTVKHGRERALFFVDQILDMVAYPCPASYGNNGQRTGPWINGRSDLKYPDPEKCDPHDYPEYTPPPCKFDGNVQDKACAGFTSAGCYTTPNGNVDDNAQCKDATVLKRDSLDWNACQKNCFDEPMCKGLQFHGSNECIQYSNEPSSQHVENEQDRYWCMKKVPVPDANGTSFILI